MALTFNQVKGVFFLGMVVFLWVASAVLIRAIFTDPSTNFNKPLFLTYFSTAWFSLYLFPLLLKLFKLYCLKPKPQDPNREHTDNEEEPINVTQKM